MYVMYNTELELQSPRHSTIRVFLRLTKGLIYVLLSLFMTCKWLPRKRSTYFLEGF